MYGVLYANISESMAINRFAVVYIATFGHQLRKSLVYRPRPTLCDRRLIVRRAGRPYLDIDEKHSIYWSIVASVSSGTRLQTRISQKFRRWLQLSFTDHFSDPGGTFGSVCLAACVLTIMMNLTAFGWDISHAGSSWHYLGQEGEGRRSKFTATRGKVVGVMA